MVSYMVCFSCSLVHQSNWNIIANVSAADQSQMMQDQMSGAAMAMPQDPKAAFKAEWEALEITENNFILQNTASDLVKSIEGSS